MGRLPEDVNNGGFSPDFGKTVWHMAVGLILGWWCCRLSMRLQYFFGRPPWQAPWTLSCLLQAVLPALSFAASVLHHLVGADCLLRRACGGHAAAPHLCKQVRAVAPSKVPSGFVRWATRLVAGGVELSLWPLRLLLSANAHAVVQPMKPNPRLLRRVIAYCLPEGFSQDPRFGPLEERWCTHLMVGAESMVTHANGVQTNHEQFYMSWSVCFSAAQGLPRLFLASARFSEQDAWEVDLAECRLPPRAPLAWAAAAQEIHELRAAGRDVSAGLCDARELCSVRFQGSRWQVQTAQLAPAEDWALLHKDLFGCPLEGGPERCVRLLLALSCPNPFAQEPPKLEMALNALRPWLEPRNPD
ncbi:unnamed protein product [Symbiodinium natans]|uniref:Uncharacterized protein n=1 Tax=Symbiodinium natans TaxID=878477 RepID=A0A812J721_9DINO|nr:unnamed protein product [Symbiodinium natans]